jgi:uncharacterized membrane protein
MADSSLRARSIPEIVDAAFSLYRRDFLSYTMVSALAYSPVIVMQLLVQGAGTLLASLGVLVSALVSIFSFALTSGLIARMGSDVYLGGHADVGRAISRVVPRIPAIIGGSLLTTLLIFFGLLFFVLPAIYIGVRLFAVPTVIVLEGLGPLNALTRSGQLTEGRKWHVFLTLALVYVLYFILSLGITIGASTLGGPLLETIITSVFSIFGYPVLSLVSLVLYYDMRIRGEGFDVEHLASTLGGAPPMSGPTPSGSMG